MKNKPLTYLLIVSVAAVWGIIFYRVFSARADEGPNLAPLVQHASAPENLDNYRFKDTSILQLNYRDPFTGNAVPVFDKPGSTAKEITALAGPELNQVPAVNWTVVKYTGYVFNASKKAAVAIMTIKGKEYMMRQGEVQDGVELLTVASNSVTVLYQANTKNIFIE